MVRILILLWWSGGVLTFVAVLNLFPEAIYSEDCFKSEELNLFMCTRETFKV